MRCLRWGHVKLAIPALAVVAACTPTSYAYKFQLTEPGAHLAAAPGERDSLEDDTVRAEIQIADDAIVLELTNKTTEVLQVEWSKIAIDRGDGIKTRLRPTIDLGWIDPGTKVSAQLAPFALPHTGTAAARYEGRRLELSVPVVALREPKIYRFHFLVHVHSL